MLDALGILQGGKTVVALTGAGGKTTIIKKLQKECYGKGIPSIVTTTTHIQRLQESFCVADPSFEQFKEILLKEKRIWTGSACGEKKLKAMNDVLFRQVMSLKVPVFIEADGAKHMPCKAPESFEPVLPPQTQLVLCVYGLDALGKSIQEACFRRDKVTQILGKTKEDILTESDIVRLAVCGHGGKKGVRPGMDYQVVLNKADDRELLRSGRRIAEEIFSQGISRVHITAGLQ